MQLEAIHGFACPDLVLEKVKRLTPEVTDTKIIKDINTEHASKVAAARLAEGSGSPPGMGKGGSADPWHSGRKEGAGGAELIDPPVGTSPR